MLNMSDFNPPSTGSWHLETVHAWRPRSSIMTAIGCDESATAGFAESMRRYGLLLERIDFGEINRFQYTCVRAVGAPRRASAGPPPKLVFTLMTKMHPEIRRRNRTISGVFASKMWRQDVDRWDNEIKPELIRKNTGLQHVDLGGLDDVKLIEHLGRCFAAVSDSWRQHHALNATCLLPVGDFLVHAQDWTGAGVDTLLPVLSGASPASLGAVAELAGVRAALISDPPAAALLDGDDAEETIAALLAHPGDVGAAVRAYLDVAGVRMVTGYDVADLTLAEMPDVVVGNLRAALASRSSNGDAMVSDRAGAGRPVIPASAGEVRAMVPPDHHREFDDLLVEARLTYRIRDERTYFNDTWSTGIARRAVLEAGRRLAADGRLHAADDAVELVPAELYAALRGDGAAIADIAAERTAFRLGHTTDDAPEWVGGPEPGDPPPAEWLPPDAARGQRAIGLVINSIFESTPAAGSARVISGTGASSGAVTGSARVVLAPAEMGRLRQGDVLVAPYTSPAFNGVLPLVSAIVTDRGGSLSHAAIVAREFGIPAVVGCGDATRRVKDGQTIDVDGQAGTVSLR